MLDNLTLGILVGGMSSRMGKDKAWLQYGQLSFVEQLVGILSPLGTVCLSAAARQQEQFAKLGLPVVYDKNDNLGPLSGIKSLLNYSKTDWCFVCAVDMVRLEANLVRFLYEFCSSDYDCICLKVADKVEPLCAIYNKSALLVLEKQLELRDLKLQNLLTRLSTKYVSLEWSCFSNECLTNVNTPADYAALLRNKPKVFCICGVKNSGKTTLICNLLPLFKRAGYRVSVIKHDGHSFVVDYPDTDTARFTVAGADKSLIYDSQHYAVLGNESIQIERMVKLCDNSDFVIIEGLKDSHWPKIEVVRSKISGELVSEQQNLLAVVTDVPELQELPLPSFQLQAYEKLYNFILTKQMLLQ